MKTILLITCLLIALLISNNMDAHDTTETSAIINTTPVKHDPATQGLTNHGFYTIHPLIVHFPIVLLIVAAALQLVNLFFKNRALTYTIFGITTAGLITAYVSSSFLHPHTTGLSENAKVILKEHEQWSSYTLYAAAIAFVLQIGSVFFLKNKFILNILVALVLSASGVFVSLAGHHGAQLTHIEGVGPLGNFIIQHKH